MLMLVSMLQNDNVNMLFFDRYNVYHAHHVSLASKHENIY